ncbi:MAG: hypothetical protein ACOYN4_20495 [Bacteroidales bacterium]
MKKLLVLIIMLTIGIATLNAQAPPPPPDTGNNGGNNGFVGGSAAPIGNGTFILLTLAVAFAGRKVYKVKAAESQE